MSIKIKIGSSFSCVSTYLSSPFQKKATLKLSSRLGPFGSHAEKLRHNKVIKSCQIICTKGSFSKRKHILFCTSEGAESSNDVEPDEPDILDQEDTTFTDISFNEIEPISDGKTGFVSFYRRVHRQSEDDKKQRDSLLWFVGPTVLVASFVFPSLYLRRILSTIFEDSLLTDFLILFFTEALFYCGVAFFLLLIDRLRRPLGPSTNLHLSSHLGYRISSVSVLFLSLTIPMVTMGFVWPWTGPAASATLAPYLVGIVVQFAFEQYARYRNSPSWPAIPVIFQVYRLHQLNRAAQLVTALSFTVRGAEMTSHNLAINGSLSTLLNVLQFLGIICIWSLASFIIRYFPNDVTPEP